MCGCMGELSQMHHKEPKIVTSVSSMLWMEKMDGEEGFEDYFGGGKLPYFSAKFPTIPLEDVKLLVYRPRYWLRLS